jgi:hypothetical protein
MAETETTSTSSSIPDEADSPAVAQGDSSPAAVQVVSQEPSKESANSVDSLSLFRSEEPDSLSLFLSEGPGSCEIDVPPSQSPAYVVTVRTRLPDSEPKSVEKARPLRIPRRAPGGTSGRQFEYETVDGLRELEAKLVGLRTLHHQCSDIEWRLARAEDILQRVCEMVGKNSPLKELCASIDERLSRTEEALYRTESLVADRTLQRLSARIDVRLAEVEDAIRRIEKSVESASLHHLQAKIDGRSTQAERQPTRLETPLEASTMSPADARPVIAEDGRTINRGGDSAWTADIQRLIVSSAAVWGGAHSVLHHAVAATAAIGLVTRETMAQALLSAQHLATTVAATGAFVAAQRAGRRCAPAVVLVATMAVTTIVSHDSRLRTTPPTPVEPPSEQEVGPAPTSIAKDPVGALDFLGSLAIASEPSGATVFVNGQRVGVTPLELPARQAGLFVLQVTREGFQRWTSAIQISAGRSTQVKATLRPSAR